MTRSQISLQIRDKPIAITKPWVYIHGQYGLEEIKNLPTLLLDWRNWLPSVFTENHVFLEFFNHFYTQTKKFPAFSANSFDTLWNTTFGTYQNLEKTKNVYLSMQKLEKVISERILLHQNIERLQSSEKKMMQFAENTLFQSKQDLLAKLKIELANIQPTYEIQHDEILVHNKRMEQMESDQKSFKIQQNRLKQSQRNLFNQTNSITSKMDAFDPQIQVYLDKLQQPHLEPKSADFIRINQKYQNLLAQYETWKSERSEIMQKSRNVNKSLVDLRKKNKTINKQYRLFKTHFTTISDRYSEIDQQYSGLQSQITRLEQEIQTIISTQENHAVPSDITTPANQIAFISPNQVRVEIQQNESRLNLIDQKLNDIFHSTDPSVIRPLMKDKYQKISDKVLVFNKTLKKMKPKKIIAPMFHSLLQFLNKIEDIMNQLLLPHELRTELIFFQKSEESAAFEIQTSIYQKNHLLGSESDLNRVLRAYFYFAFIIGVYLAANLPVIPIHLDYLPSFMKTKQTFQKSTMMLKENLSHIQKTSDLHVILFTGSETFDISPLITIKED